MADDKGGEPVDEEEPELDLTDIVLTFLENHRDAIDAAIKEWGKGGRRRSWMLGAVMGFLAFIVLFTGLLAHYGSLSGEAFTFLVGTVLMYLFNLIGPRIQIG